MRELSPGIPVSLGRGITKGVTTLHDQYANLTGEQQTGYQYLIDATYSFRDSAHRAILTATDAFQPGSSVRAQYWSDQAFTEYQRESQAQSAASNLVRGLQNITYDFVDFIYLGSKFAWSTTCDFLGPQRALCGAVGDQLFIVTDSIIDRDLSFNTLAKAEISQGIAKLLLKVLGIDGLNEIASGKATLGQSLQAIVNSPSFMLLSAMH